ncbi:MAG: hypothetical protein A2150_08105 [Candidatus Muproteobacteria bacterium RBG_16_64_11]|uniref:Uncharacterized protein n=1 Tax=Candidatus Muproteobacteria bacterium RBG_16_64_11 TaxID=1817758 RepID=A0A1F6TB53_9PROT|nr:MAG: hypothetical protein A2150_08105 [Candidatus Muproteobacteria bacterium RBG_16_64_11]
MGNGDDDPPPGHSYNHNDYAGTSPGNPGAQGGNGYERDHDDDHGSSSSGGCGDHDDDGDDDHGGNCPIETFRTADGDELSARQVGLLVQAMAGFAPDSFDAVLAAAWDNS